jgi:hypothetical protein
VLNVKQIMGSDRKLRNHVNTVHKVVARSDVVVVQQRENEVFILCRLV